MNFQATRTLLADFYARNRDVIRVAVVAFVVVVLGAILAS